MLCYLNKKTDETAKDFFAAPWKTIFLSPVEQELSKNNLLTTIARLGKEWRVSVQVNLRTPPSCTSPPGAQALDRVTRLGTERPTRGVRLHSAERETKLF